MEEEKKFVFDANAVMYTLYLLFKCNIITRHNLKNMLKLIKESTTEDIIKFIAQEAARAT